MTTQFKATFCYRHFEKYTLNFSEDVVYVKT